MALKLYETQRKKKVLFDPITPGKVGIYVCGVTVYDFCHIGHARTFVCFDVILRYLKHLGYQTFFVRNITDVDDKILQRSKELGISCSELTGQMIEKMHEDFQALNLLSPDVEPKATDHIGEMISCIERLFAQGAAYIANESGDVYFKVSACADYGVLSGQNIQELFQGHRVDAEAKIASQDFVLWKIVSNPNELAWASPWGRGRPGWHIECSAMSRRWLGSTFDIHGGGGDLKFPHHENERAQSICANQQPFANYWLHTGMVQILDQKMSKSLNNFLTIREALSQEHPEVLRYFLMMAHYRSPLHYCLENLNLARQGLYRLYNALYEAEEIQLTCEHSSSTTPFENVADLAQAFEEAMQDDFNVPQALSVLFELASKIFKAKKSGNDALCGALSTQLRELGRVLGILHHRPLEVLQYSHGNADERAQRHAAIETLLLKRQRARERKLWGEADAIRQKLFEQYYVLVEDKGSETLWRYR